MRITGRGTPADITLEAAADYSASTYQYTFVGLSAGASGGPQARVTAVTSGAGAFIMQNRPKQYKGAVIRLRGTSSLKVDGSGTAISVGDFLKPGTGGKGVKCSAGDAYSAVAMEASTADGDEIEVLVERGLTHA
jgi:hypothetical protein